MLALFVSNILLQRLLNAKELNNYNKSRGIIPVTLFPTNLKKVMRHQVHLQLCVIYSLLVEKNYQFLLAKSFHFYSDSYRDI
jgi:hypothetical protein